MRGTLGMEWPPKYSRIFLIVFLSLPFFMSFQNCQGRFDQLHAEGDLVAGSESEAVQAEDTTPTGTENTAPEPEPSPRVNDLKSFFSEGGASFLIQKSTGEAAARQEAKEVCAGEEFPYLTTPPAAIHQALVRLDICAHMKELDSIQAIVEGLLRPSSTHRKLDDLCVEDPELSFRWVLRHNDHVAQLANGCRLGFGHIDVNGMTFENIDEIVVHRRYSKNDVESLGRYVRETSSEALVREEVNVQVCDSLDAACTPQVVSRGKSFPVSENSVESFQDAIDLLDPRVSYRMVLSGHLLPRGGTRIIEITEFDFFGDDTMAKSQPICEAQGSDNEGWQMDNGELLPASCANHKVACRHNAITSGWHVFQIVDATPEGLRQELAGRCWKKIPPTCINVGTDNEGWSFEDGRFFFDRCAHKSAECRGIGTSRESWIFTERFNERFLTASLCE